jgi:hypothetical protein
MSDKYPGGFITAGAPAGFSVFFDGTGDGFSYTGTTFGSGAWTVELWFYFTGTSFTGPIQFFEGTTDSLVLAIMSNTTIRVDEVNVSNDLYTVPTMSANTWYHVAATKDASGNQTLFLNGVRSSTGVTTTSRNFSTATLRIGYSIIGATDFTGYISNLRFVTGTAVYNPLSTTINVPTQLFPISGTQLLICQSPTAIDNSSNAYTLSPNGTPTVSNFTPFAAFSGSLVPRSSPQTASGIWTIDEAAYFTTQGLWPTAPDVPQKSLRFNSADSAFLNRTPTTASNRSTWTWSGWVKRSDVSSNYFMLFSAINGANRDYITFDNSNRLNVDINNGTSGQLISTQVFRDVGAWYHIVIAFDSTSPISANRIIAYVNGVQVTAFASYTAPSLNYQTGFDNNVVHKIGDAAQSGGFYFSGYMTEVNFIDGQALNATAFGAFEGGTGVWSPAPYSGTYGTNGFYLRFLDNSNTTAATLGKDSSPNGNNWTPNNFSVTAGVGNDSMLDTPNRFGTDTGIGGQVGGSYCTLNPLDRGSDVNTVVNGNLDATWNSNNGHSIRSTMSVSSGKWYWEFTNVNNLSCGVIQQQLKIVPQTGSLWPGSDGFGVGGSFAYRADNGNKTTNSVGTAYGASFTTTDVIGCALDMDNGKIWWSKNGVWQASGDPAAGTNEAYSGLSGVFSPAWGYINPGANTLTTNFGQRAFAYTAPTGFKALVSSNLATPAVGASNATLANKNFDVSLWTGIGQTGSASITGLAFQPDFVWAKQRSGGVSHLLYDVLRGPSTSSASKALVSNSGSAEGASNDNTTNGYLSSFNSDGFGYFGGSSPAYFSANSATYVGWQWKGGGAGVTNTNGSITSTVSANLIAGFSIVTYTSTTGTVGHGLGVAPKFIIMKARNATDQWTVGNPFFNAGVNPWNYGTTLNDTVGTQLNTGFWNGTAPTSSVFSQGSWDNGNTKVAYCFAEVAGFSRISNYRGNGSTDGTFVYCGFRPRFIIIKRLDTDIESWGIIDSARDTYNVANRRLFPNLASAENTGDSTVVDLLSNGFKLRSTDALSNANNGTYFFMALAESPFNYSRAR